MSKQSAPRISLLPPAKTLPKDWLRRLAGVLARAGQPVFAGIPGIQVARLPGSHYSDNSYTAVAETVGQFTRAAPTEKRP